MVEKLFTYSFSSIDRQYCKSKLKLNHLFKEILACLLEYLTSKSATFKLNELTEDGRDPLDLAIESGSCDCISLLLDAGHAVSPRHLDRARELGNPLIFQSLMSSSHQVASIGHKPQGVSYITSGDEGLFTKSKLKVADEGDERFESATVVESNRQGLKGMIGQLKVASHEKKVDEIDDEEYTFKVVKVRRLKALSHIIEQVW